MGSQELYDWLEDEPDRFYPGDVDHVHAPERMGRLSSFISINGGVQFPTGGIAHEPKGMTRCDSGADSIVWTEEDRVLRGVIYLRA